MNVATITDQLDTRWTWRSWAELVGQHPRLPMALPGLMPTGCTRTWTHSWRVEGWPLCGSSTVSPANAARSEKTPAWAS